MLSLAVVRVAVYLLCAGLVSSVNAQSPSFDSDVLPLLQAKCFACHSGGSPQAGLDLRSPASMLKGGKSGPAIAAGYSDKSLLIDKVSLRVMPPTDPKLTDQEIDLLRRWIDKGAPQSASRSGEAAVAVPITEYDVLPVFQAHCTVCHGKRKQEGGLDLRTRAGCLKGGKSGPALIAGNPDQSLLVQKIVSGQMPPLKLQFANSVRPTTVAELDKLKRWIAAGAPAGSLATGHKQDPVKETDRNFWSFQPPKRPPVPVVSNQNRIRNPIDAFLLAKLEQKQLGFSPEAAPLVLLRRAYIDLTGMPPAPEEMQAFQNDKRPDAYERMIDRLLASPAYGERWARYWLDLAGYYDSEAAGNVDTIRPYAWRYRDYVIRSFNSDKPYSTFLTEQIAGDELLDYKQLTQGKQQVKQDDIDRLAATGFLRLAPDITDLPELAFIGERTAVIADEMEILTSSVMGLTVGCARCHDHKYDPIPQRDYYRLSAVLQAAFDPYDWSPPKKRQIEIGLESEWQQVKAFNTPIEAEIKKLEDLLARVEAPNREKLLEQRLAAFPESVRDDLRTISKKPAAERSEIQKYLTEKFKDTLTITTAELSAKFSEFKVKADPIQKDLAAKKAALKPNPHIRVLTDMDGEPSPAYVFRRGEPLNPGEQVEPGVPSVLQVGLEPYRIVPPWPGSHSTGRRLALARWLTQPNHPLTSRVMVNQIWMRHFGRGLVASPANFGRSGEPPSHPELLDWLATEFVRTGWTVKSIQRLIMTSAAYRQSSGLPDQVLAADPENILLSRMPLQRLDAEALYDSILKVTGRLDPTPFGSPEEVEVKPDKEIVPKGGKNGFRRSIYVRQLRQQLVTMHEVFDLAPMTPNCVERSHSTVSTQALQLMNGSITWDHARYMAGRIMDTAGENRENQIEQVYLRALSRRPSSDEVRDALRDLDKFSGSWQARLQADHDVAPHMWSAPWLALASFCHAVMNSAEFLYVD